MYRSSKQMLIYLLVSISSVACTESKEEENLCDSTHYKVGMQVELENTGQHPHYPTGNVSITDSCAIEVQQFNWDALGDETYVWAGFFDDIGNGFAISETINGDEEYEDATLQYQLPTDKSLDDFDCITIYELEINEVFAWAMFTE
jgi:hypothetical protein